MPKKKTQKRESDNMLQQTSLKSICEGNMILRPWFKSGIQAIKSEYRARLKFPDTKDCGGSIDFDEALKSTYSQENRWDYGIEYDKNLIYIEFHPAKMSEIPCIIKKVDFIRKWTADKCPELNLLPKFEKHDRQFYWIASGKSSLAILPNSKYAKQLALKHIAPIGTIFDYAKLNDNPSR